MAKNSNPSTTDHPPAMDYRAHESTYSAFIKLSKWAILGIAIAVVILFFVIQP